MIINSIYSDFIVVKLKERQTIYNFYKYPKLRFNVKNAWRSGNPIKLKIPLAYHWKTKSFNGKLDRFIFILSPLSLLSLSKLLCLPSASILYLVGPIQIIRDTVTLWGKSTTCHVNFFCFLKTLILIILEVKGHVWK